VDLAIQLESFTLANGRIIPNISLFNGDSLLVLGRSGTGKSDFCSQLLKNARFYHSCANENYLSDIGYIPSNPYLVFSGMKSTLRGELELSYQFLAQATNDLINIASLFQIDNLLDRDVFTLSGGEAVRAATALIAVKRPRIWIFDQVFDWLHPNQREVYKKTIQEIVGAKTIIIETHSIIPKWSQNFSKLLVFAKSYTKVLSQQDVLEETNLKEPDYSIFYNQKKIDHKVNKHLSIKNLCFSYKPTKNQTSTNFSLKSINISAYSGERIALVGKNGAGKTTFLKAFALLLKPLAGHVLLDTVELSDKLYIRAKSVLYCFQNPDDQLFLPTAKEEILSTVKYLAPERKKLDADLLTRFELQALLNEDPITLGRSIKRMLTLATAFHVNSKVLLFDEPTSYLDSYQKIQLAQEFINYSQNGGILFFVSHDEEFVSALATRVVHFEDGRLMDC
jgi:energy-coupling factor transport system ATP-binding protein